MLQIYTDASLSYKKIAPKNVLKQMMLWMQKMKN